MTIRRRGGLAMIAGSLGGSVIFTANLDADLIRAAADVPVLILVSAVMFNVAAILQSAVGGVIEWRRPGHRIGRLFLLTGPIYAGLAMIWLTAGGPSDASSELSAIEAWVAILLSYGGVALLIAGVPLLFPTGALPNPRWRWYVSVPGVPFVAALVSIATRPGDLGQGSNIHNPFGVSGWPAVLAPVADGIFIWLLGLVAVGLAAQVVRYRRGDRIERLQVRWFGLSIAVVLFGFTGTTIEISLFPHDGPAFFGVVAYLGILLMPITIGIAVTRYRLYEIDRIVSRTIGWALVTGITVATFAGVVVALSAALDGVTQGDTLAVAASTLVAASLFQPLRRRVQAAVDRRFDRARYDAERTAAIFAERLRDQVDLGGLRADVAGTVSEALRPSSTGLWIRGGSEAAE